MRLLQAVFLVVVSASPAFAQRQPVIVIPGKPGVPVLLNGVDVSYAVIEGEFGLSRPIMVNPTVVYRPFALPPVYGPDIYPGNEAPATARPTTAIFRRPAAAPAMAGSRSCRRPTGRCRRRRRPFIAAGRASPDRVRSPTTLRIPIRCRTSISGRNSVTAASAASTTRTSRAGRAGIRRVRNVLRLGRAVVWPSSASLKGQFWKEVSCLSIA